MAEKANFLCKLFTPIKTPKSYVQQYLKGYGCVSTLVVYIFGKNSQSELSNCLSKLYDLVALTSAPHSKPYYLEKITELQNELVGSHGRKELYKRLEKADIPIYIHFDKVSVYFIVNHDYFSGYTGLLFSKYANFLLKKDKIKSNEYLLIIRRLYNGNDQYSYFDRVVGLGKAIFLGIGLILSNKKEGRANPFFLKEGGDVYGELDDIVLVSAKVESDEISFENILTTLIDSFTCIFDRHRANILITQEFIHGIPKQGGNLRGIGNTASGFYFSLKGLDDFARHQIFLLKKYHIAYYAVVLLDMLKVEKKLNSNISEDFIFSYLPAREDGCIATYSITRDALVFAISKSVDGYHIDVTVNKAIFSLETVLFFLKQISAEVELLEI
ncbi:hypothetical protein ACJJIE_06385 [Microbulbifer sp. TRSA001]|uniref:hypothetical protein n=1 Tax=unclassified Microbulbifer TaxID=2619833 RepID=UPI0024AD1009|nr:hypothetical protein [Microbulbifer sp. VAAF005]WHI47288.1 hypothetical protein P0078_02605 [Microbulbifer sp. VAAF005]